MGILGKDWGGGKVKAPVILRDRHPYETKVDLSSLTQ